MNTLDPAAKPKEALTTVIAAALMIFSNKPWQTKDYFEAAETFIAEAERRYGKINP